MKLQTLTLLLLAIIFASSFIISTESTTIKTDNRILKSKSSIEPDETTQQQEDTQTRSTNTGQDDIKQIKHDKIYYMYHGIIDNQFT